MRTRSVVVVLMAALGLAGCTAEPSENESSTVEHPKAERPVARDARAVFAALAQLDFCAVLGAAAPGSRPSAYEPGTCQTGFPPSGVTMSVGDLPSGTRLGLPSRPIGGAKAYVRDTGSRCSILFPLSFRLVLEFTGGTCDVVEPVAAAAATTVADPAAGRTTSRWNACDALRLAVDAKLGWQTSVDHCATEDGVNALAFTHQYPGSDPDRQPVAESMGDTQVWVLDASKDPENTEPNCEVSWAVGPTTTAIPAGYVPTVTVAASSCAAARDLAEELIPAMRESPPDDVTPQQPLLYAPDEPDSPQPGGCAYTAIAPNAECEPYVEVPVPDDAAAILAGSDADPNVTCAVVLDEVTAAFGARFQPITMDHPDSHTCVFVEPDRLLEIDVTIWSESLGRETTYPGTTDVEYAGHPGRVRTGNEYSAWVSTATTIDEGGTVSFSIWPGEASSTLSQEEIATVEPVLTEILRNHFS